jgi:aryl-alcohol dehydrogenase-like predicted oxidoreductase
MQYRYMGKTGLKVSELCLGAMTFGRESDVETSNQMMDGFTEAGGNFIDTADVYSRGISEEVVGNWLSNQDREDFVLATKVRFPMSDGVNDVGLSRKHILAGVEKSLKRLKVDYIDLYQVHCYDYDTPLEETMQTLNTLVTQGKVRYLGVSNFKSYQIQKANDIAKAHGWESFTCLQPLYNLLDRFIDWELTEVCEAEGLGIIPWSPLRGGWLTGKYRRDMDNLPDDGRIKKATAEGWSESWDNYNTDRTWAIIETLISIAGELGKEPAQVALNWVKDRPHITSPIIGVRTMGQLESNLGSVGWELSEEHLNKLNEVSKMSLPYYPYVQIEGARARR